MVNESENKNLFVWKVWFILLVYALYWRLSTANLLSINISKLFAFRTELSVSLKYTESTFNRKLNYNNTNYYKNATKILIKVKTHDVSKIEAYL